MNRDEVIDSLRNIEGKTCQVYVRYMNDKLTIYTIRDIVKLNGESFSILDKEGAEIIIPYISVERIIKRNRVDWNGRR